MNSKVDTDSIKWIEGKVRGFHGKALIDMNAGAVKPGSILAQITHNTGILIKPSTPMYLTATWNLR